MDVVQICCVVEDVLRVLAIVAVLVLVCISWYISSNEEKIKDEWWLTRADKRNRKKAEKLARKQAEAERKKWESIYAKYAD